MGKTALEEAIEMHLAEQADKDKDKPGSGRQVNMRLSPGMYSLLEDLSEKLELSISATASLLVSNAIFDAYEYVGMQAELNAEYRAEVRRQYPSIKFAYEVIDMEVLD